MMLLEFNRTSQSLIFLLMYGTLSGPAPSSPRCYSEASDAFSFGVVLYEMFARRGPWEGHENLDVAFRVWSGERMQVSHPSQKDLAVCAHVRLGGYSFSPALHENYNPITTVIAIGT